MDNEKKNESIISFTFVVAGFLAFFITGVVLDVLAGTFGIVQQFRSKPVVQHGLPVSVGIIVFLALFLNKKTHLFADEAITEVRKVVWPSRKDTVAMTIVCCVMVVVAGIGFGIFDFFASQLIKVFVN